MTMASYEAAEMPKLAPLYCSVRVRSWVAACQLRRSSRGCHCCSCSRKALSSVAGLDEAGGPATNRCQCVIGEQGLFGQDSREAAEQLDAFAMAPGMEAPALAPFVSDPGMDWVRDDKCRIATI